MPWLSGQKGSFLPDMHTWLRDGKVTLPPSHPLIAVWFSPNVCFTLCGSALTSASHRCAWSSASLKAWSSGLQVATSLFMCLRFRSCARSVRVAVYRRQRWQGGRACVVAMVGRNLGRLSTARNKQGVKDELFWCHEFMARQHRCCIATPRSKALAYAMTLLSALLKRRREKSWTLAGCQGAHCH